MIVITELLICQWNIEFKIFYNLVVHSYWINLLQILSFVENVENVSKGAMKMKGNIVKYIASLDEICREMLELRRQIHPVHGLGNDETSKLTWFIT